MKMTHMAKAKPKTFIPQYFIKKRKNQNVYINMNNNATKQIIIIMNA